MALKILFTRHGETEDNVAQRLSTSAPGPRLTALGEQQAAIIAGLIDNEQLSAIYCSPLVRARQTAEIIRGTRNIQLVDVEDLRELSVGAREGRSDQAVFDEMDEVWHAWTVVGDLNVLAGPGGENAVEVLDRGLRAVADITEKHSDGTILIVAHSGVLQLLIPHLCLNIDKSHGAKNWLRNGDVVEVRSDADRFICVSWAGKAIG